MGLFGKGVDDIKEVLNRNISKFTQWINYFQQKNNEQDSRLALIESKLSAINYNHDHVNYVFSRINDLEKGRFGSEERSRLNYVYQKIHELEQKGDSKEHINILSNNQMHLLNKIKELEEKIESTGQRRSVAMQPRTAHEKIVKKVAQKSKDYIKNSMLNLIKKYENLTGSQLKEILVEEQGLCSKSSFYRILEEIEKEDKIKSVRKGREKTYQLVQVLR